MSRDKYAWPGGYPILYLDTDDSVLCADCAGKSDTLQDFRTGNQHSTAFIHYEGDPLHCEGCNCVTESAYGPLEENE